MNLLSGRGIEGKVCLPGLAMGMVLGLTGPALTKTMEDRALMVDQEDCPTGGGRVST
jgi:hypothetical protein